MNMDEYKMNQDGTVSIQTPNGGTISVDGNNDANNEILQDLFNSRLGEIQPQIASINENIFDVQNMTPIEEAEFDYYKLRADNLEQENKQLRVIVRGLRTPATEVFNVGQNQPIASPRIAVLKSQFKEFVRNSKFELLWERVALNLKNESATYNNFVQIFSKYGKYKSEKNIGLLSSKDDYQTHAEITFSLISNIDAIKTEELKN